MINAVIIDDETLHLENLRNKISEFSPEVNIIASLSSGNEALQLLPKIKTDLLFLDIELGDMTAFELLEKLGSHDFSFIFVTAYDKYAVKAFKFNAIDYLLKPVDGHELIEAVDKAKSKILTNDNKFNLLEDYNLLKYNKLLVREKTSFIYIPIEDIVSCHSDNNYTVIYFMEKDCETQIVSSKNLKYYDDKLSPYHFLRISQEEVINGNKVKKVLRNKSIIILTNGKEYHIAKRRKNDVIEKLNTISLG